jgi:lysozyme
MTKRRRNSGWIGLVFVILIFLAYRLVQGLSPFDDSTRDQEVTFRMYPGFGIELPEDYAIHGIDVSRYQSNVNWGMVKEMRSSDVKLGFAFIKARRPRRYYVWGYHYKNAQ